MNAVVLEDNWIPNGREKGLQLVAEHHRWVEICPTLSQYDNHSSNDQSSHLHMLTVWPNCCRQKLDSLINITFLLTFSCSHGSPASTSMGPETGYVQSVLYCLNKQSLASSPAHFKWKSAEDNLQYPSDDRVRKQSAWSVIFLWCSFHSLFLTFTVTWNSLEMLQGPKRPHLSFEGNHLEVALHMNIFLISQTWHAYWWLLAGCMPFIHPIY